MSDLQPQVAPEHCFAAVDLGSNSFHLIVARFQHGQLQVVDRLREPVRLAAGLDGEHRLADDARERALACLERFGQRLKHLPLGHVRAVGTNALRRAQASGAFLHESRAALGRPIEVISGVEEARLIYLGVSHSLPDAAGRRLVMDIGGGSTELIVGEAFEALHLESLYMGCVSFSERYFPDGAINKASWRAAEMAARLELRPVKDRFRRLGWDGAAGASGTIRAIRQVLQANGWCEEGISREGLRKLRKAILQVERAEQLQLDGLQEERKPVIAGGAAILYAIFETLDIDGMRVSDGALREGLLYDALGRIRHEDVRERTVTVLSERYHIEQAHAQRVEASAIGLFEQVRKVWKLNKEEHEWMLRWAARLHEIGLVIAHSGYQKHGAYLLENSDLPGFSRREQALLAVLVRGHRRKLSLATCKPHGKAAQRLCILLRLAILLHRSRADVPVSEPRLRVDAESLALEFPESWLEQHPLTEADLLREAEYLKAAKWELRLR